MTLTLRHIRISASRTLSDNHTILSTAAVLAVDVHNFAYEYFRMLLLLLYFFPERVVDISTFILAVLSLRVMFTQRQHFKASRYFVTVYLTKIAPSLHIKVHPRTYHECPERE